MANPNVQNENGETAMMLLLGAVIPFDFTFESYDEVEDEYNFEKIEQILDFLCAKGASCNIVNKNKQTPLYYAVTSSTPHLLKWYLRKWFFDINSTDKFGNTCLDGLQSSIDEELQTPDCCNIAILLSYGAKKGNHNPGENSMTINCQQIENHCCDADTFNEKVNLLSKGHRQAIVVEPGSANNEYVEELLRMQKIVLTCNKTVYDLIFINRKLLVDLSENAILKSLLTSYENYFETFFPLMGDFVSAKIFQGMYRKVLVQSALKLFAKLFNFDYPEFLMKEIIFWLPNCEIIAMLKFHDDENIGKNFLFCE